MEIETTLTAEQMRALKAACANNPVASSLQHELGNLGLLEFTAAPRPKWTPTPQGRAIVAREKANEDARMEAIIASARATVKRNVDPEPTVKYVSRIQTGLMKEEITLEKISNGIIRIYFPHKPIWRVRDALKAARFSYYEKGDYWSRQDDDVALGFIQKWLSHDEYVESDTEAGETQQKPVYAEKRAISDRARLMSLQADAYVCGLEMEATKLEMWAEMGECEKRYRLAAEVVNLINMGLWR